MEELAENVVLGGSTSVTVEKFFASDLFTATVRSGAYDERLDQITECYREFFAWKPWNEYLKCADPTCMGRFGAGEILEARGLEPPANFNLADLESAGILNGEALACPKCGGAMRLFYPLEATRKRIKSELSKNVTGVLLWDYSGKISGFVWAWLTTYQELFGDRIEAAFAGRLSYAQYCSSLEHAQRNLSDRVFFISEWGLAERLRGSGASAVLLEKLREVSLSRLSKWVDSSDVVTLSATGNRAKVLFKSLGSDDLYNDGTTNIMYIPATRLLDAFNHRAVQKLMRPEEGHPASPNTER